MALLDFAAITVALAARLDPVNVTPPTGEDNIKLSDAYAPGNVTRFPHAVTMPPHTGDLEYADGIREGTHVFDVLVVFAAAGGTERVQERIAKWLGVLLNVYYGAIQLGGGLGVALVRVEGYEVGMRRYGEEDYPAILLNVAVVTVDDVASVA